MASMSPASTCQLLAMILFATTAYYCFTSANRERKIHIIYMGPKPKGGFSVESVHLDILEKVLEGSSPKQSLIYSYSKSFNGFAAWLTEEEKKKLVDMENVVSVFPSRKRQLHTTRSWNFLRFPTTVKRVPKVESDIIIGVIDSGIWPESLSFNVNGIGPPPSKWQGSCQNFTCNNKIIGAKYYNAYGDFIDEEISPRDINGHGTHVASTIAGSEVTDISLLGIAEGTVRGAVPSARIAVYKVPQDVYYNDQSILAAFDDAINDGVDIICISFGYDAPGEEEFLSDGLAIGAFHAMQNGILVSASGGNFGPDPQTLQNSAPWILTVAASTIDRKILNWVTLGNHEVIEGLAVNTFPDEEKFIPLLYEGEPTNSLAQEEYSRCVHGTLDKNLVQGKIVVCLGLGDGRVPYEAGAHGVVMLTQSPVDVAHSYPLPAIVISNADDVTRFKSYLFSTSSPVAHISPGDSAYNSKAPSVVSFSSRGPSQITPQVLKPDLTAPGVDILAAWSPKSTVSGFPTDQRLVSYNIVSGTSMASAHATGAAVYVKTHHPTWSPAAIKSALMTTASPMKTVDSTQGVFAYGSGQIDPVKALQPGLVYNASENDYIEMLCNIGYPEEVIRRMSGTFAICGEVTDDESSLNYPSFTASYDNTKESFTIKFRRVVTNVGSPSSIYNATVSLQSELDINVSPNPLHFSSLNEKKEIYLTVTSRGFQSNIGFTASLTWSDGIHNVTSPIFVFPRS